MDNIFVDKVNKQEKQAPKRRMTKREMNDEQYIAVCERMAQLREMRKKTASGEVPAKKPKEVKEREVIKYVDRPVEVVREVEKIIEKPVEKIVEKPVPVIQQNSMLEDEILSIKKMILDMQKPKPEPAPVQQPIPAPKPQKFIYSGPNGGFRPF